MIPKIPLEYAAVSFGVLWGGWMFWSSGPHDLMNFAIWAIAGASAGYFWYRGMSWWAHRRQQRNGADQSAP